MATLRFLKSHLSYYLIPGSKGDPLKTKAKYTYVMQIQRKLLSHCITLKQEPMGSCFEGTANKPDLR